MKKAKGKKAAAKRKTSKATGSATGVPLSTQQRQFLDEFVEDINKKVIPKIVEMVEERRILATTSREWPLKTGG